MKYCTSQNSRFKKIWKEKSSLQTNTKLRHIFSIRNYEKHSIKVFYATLSLNLSYLLRKNTVTKNIIQGKTK
jgi:hypothetical protein